MDKVISKEIFLKIEFDSKYFQSIGENSIKI